MAPLDESWQAARSRSIRTRAAPSRHKQSRTRREAHCRLGRSAGVHRDAIAVFASAGTVDKQKRSTRPPM